MGDALVPVAVTVEVLYLGDASDLGFVLGASFTSHMLFVVVGGIWAGRLPPVFKPARPVFAAYVLITAFPLQLSAHAVPVALPLLKVPPPLTVAVLANVPVAVLAMLQTAV